MKRWVITYIFLVYYSIMDLKEMSKRAKRKQNLFPFFYAEVTHWSEWRYYKSLVVGSFLPHVVRRIYANL